MRKKIHTRDRRGKCVQREINYLPLRYLLASLLTLLSILSIIALVVWLCYVIPYFYIVSYLITFACLVRLISSDDNPDYKVPWIVFVMLLPVAGFMLYLMFYSRKLHRRFVRRIGELSAYAYAKNDAEAMQALEHESTVAASQARMLTRISGSTLFRNTHQTYYPSGESMQQAMQKDLEKATNFILLEYFIIEQGAFWNNILSVLEDRAHKGVLVRVVYDDVGCMRTLPGDYYRQLRRRGIECVPFSRLRGNADSEFNNRNHRKLMIIDGKVAYTGGVNLADEYINLRTRFGHWKDSGLRLEGEGVWELTRLALSDFAINTYRLPPPPADPYPASEISDAGYLIPFGDGPRPLYTHRVGKSVIRNLLNVAQRYAYITTPYLIIDNELCQCIETAALRGVDVRILLPHVPDKKLVFHMSQSYYRRLMDAGVKILEYAPGFLHAKSYLVDDQYAMLGSINLDYRSLVHHFEVGVWMYRCTAIQALKADLTETMERCIPVTEDMLRIGPLHRLFRAIVRIFAPML